MQAAICSLSGGASEHLPLKGTPPRILGHPSPSISGSLGPGGITKKGGLLRWGGNLFFACEGTVHSKWAGSISLKRDRYGKSFNTLRSPGLRGKKNSLICLKNRFRITETIGKRGELSRIPRSRRNSVKCSRLNYMIRGA